MVNCAWNADLRRDAGVDGAWVYIMLLPRQVLVLTDGQVRNESEILAKVQATPSSRVFSLGVGHGVSTFLVKGLGRAGRGHGSTWSEAEGPGVLVFRNQTLSELFSFRTP